MSKKILRQSLIILLISSLPALVLFLVHPQRQVSKRDTLREGEVLLSTTQEWKNILWIDARQRKKFEKGHISGAFLLNESEWDNVLEQFISVWTPGQPVVVYCDSKRCKASTRIANLLRDEVGLKPVYVLKGGWESYSLNSTQ